MRGNKIKLSFCVAYDWNLLQFSLPLVYHDADEICLAIDKDRISWTGNSFAFDEQGFNALIEKIDTDKKIRIFEDDFHQPTLSPMENEVRQRNMMAEYLGKNDGWHLQMDTDEYFLNFSGFVAYLKALSPHRPVNICCPWMTLYKRIDEGFLMVTPNHFRRIEFIPIATNAPHYEHGRRNGYFNHYTDFAILHQSWARTKDEVWQKLNNWGHNKDFDIHAYFQTWENLNATNYEGLENFHPFHATEWSALKLLKGASVNDIIQHYKEDAFFKQYKYAIKMKNSIWVSRLKKLLP